MKQFKCTNCGNMVPFIIENNVAHRSKDDDLCNLWQCISCGEFFRVYFKMTKLVRLIDEK